MNDLPVPPNTPQWLDRDAFERWNTKCVDALFAAVYAQLWREECERMLNVSA